MAGIDPPFDVSKLFRLMEESGLSLVLVHTRHNVRYLSGGYCYHFHANSSRMGESQYIRFFGIPLGRPEAAFYVGRAEERGQVGAEKPWIPVFVEAIRGTLTAARGAADAIRRLGLESGRIGIELPFIPADAYLALREAFPKASFVDATALMNELRAIKSPEELDILREVYSRDAEAISSAFAASHPGDTTLEIAHRAEVEMTERGLSFLFALVCAGPGFFRAPSSATWEKGRILHIDAGGVIRDYVADICRMGCVGDPPPLADELYRACIEVQGAARLVIRAGLPSRAVVEAGEKASRAYRFSEYARFVVRGIGMVPYEEPLFAPLNDRPLEAGMVLSVETDFLHPDVGHVKIEDAVIVHEGGCEGLGDIGREWQIVHP
jgi:Xaa-Pro aminopeptidase